MVAPANGIGVLPLASADAHAATIVITVPHPPTPPEGATLSGYLIEETGRQHARSWNRRNLSDALETWLFRGTRDTDLLAQADGQDATDPDGWVMYAAKWDGEKWGPWEQQ